MPPRPMSPPPSSLLTQGWNKYRLYILAVAAVGKVIPTVDLCFPSKGPLGELLSHEYAIDASHDITVRF